MHPRPRGRRHRARDRRAPARWRRPQRFGGYGIALAAIICGAVLSLGSCGVVGVMLPALGAARQVARQRVTDSHLQQIGIGLYMYGSE